MNETQEMRNERAEQVAAQKSKREQNQRRFQMMNQGQFRSIRNDVAIALRSGRTMPHEEAQATAEILMDAGLIDVQLFV